MGYALLHIARFSIVKTLEKPCKSSEKQPSPRWCIRTADVFRATYQYTLQVLALRLPAVTLDTGGPRPVLLWDIRVLLPWWDQAVQARPGSGVSR